MKDMSSSLNFLRLANHALRTPMTVVSGCLSLLESFTEIESDQTTELISKASMRCKESSLITSDMMTITQTFLNTKTQTLRESDLKVLVLEAVENHEVQLSYPDKDINILVNETDFVSALARIVESSARWGKVRVEVESDDQKVFIRVFDEGPAITQTEDELFVEFESFSERGSGIHSLSHVYAYVLLRTNDATLTYSNMNDVALTEVQLEVLAS